MKRTLIAAVTLAALSRSAPAAEIQLKLDDGAQQAISQLPAVFDQCIAGLTLRSDAAVCKNVSNFLMALTSEVKAQQAREAKPAEQPKPEQKPAK